MTRRKLILDSLLWYLLGRAIGSSTAGASPPQMSVLKNMTELEKPVTYNETKIPLGELVQKVAVDTGVPLAAAQDVADEPVAIAVKEFSARQLLEELAHLLDYRWSRRKRRGGWRYEIWQDAASKQREEALRQSTHADIEKRFQDEIAHYVEIASLPQGRFEALLEDLEKWRGEFEKLPPEQRQAFLTSPGQRERTWRFRVASQLWSPINRALARLLGQLSPQQHAMLREGRSILFSTAPRPGELPLPEEVIRAFRGSRTSLFAPGQRGNIVLLGPEGPLSESAAAEHWAQAEEQAHQEWEQAPGYVVRVHLDLDSLPRSGSLTLRVSAAPLTADGAARAVDLPGGDTTLQLRVGPVDPRRRLEEQTPERSARLQRDEIVGVRRDFPPKRRQGHPGAQTESGGLPPHDTVPDLAEVYGVQVISDAYWGSLPSLSRSAFATSETVTLFSLLDQIPTHRWDHEGNVVRLRSRTWFLDRPREVPLRLARRWEQLCERLGALPLNEYIDAARTLTETQLEGLALLIPLQLRGDYQNTGAGVRCDLGDLKFLFARRHAVRLYASLAPWQQRALWQGAPVPVATMTPSQRDVFLAAIQDRSRQRETSLERAPAESGKFSLTYAPRDLIRDQNGQRSVLTNTASLSGTGDTTTEPTNAPRANAVSSGQGQAEPDARSGGARTYPVLQVRFHCVCDPDLRQTVPLMVAATPSPVVWC
jgi:hypothetical protein